MLVPSLDALINYRVWGLVHCSAMWHAYMFNVGHRSTCIFNAAYMCVFSVAYCVVLVLQT